MQPLLDRLGEALAVRARPWWREGTKRYLAQIAAQPDENGLSRRGRDGTGADKVGGGDNAMCAQAAEGVGSVRRMSEARIHSCLGQFSTQLEAGPAESKIGAAKHSGKQEQHRRYCCCTETLEASHRGRIVHKEHRCSTSETESPKEREQERSIDFRINQSYGI